MDKVIGYIYETYDYNKFHKTVGNREVTENRKNDLMNSLMQGQALVPIVCDNTLGIIEGQGRYEALKELNLPIWYCVDPNIKNADCARLNRYNTKWSTQNYVDLFSDNGNEDYQRLNKVQKITGISLSTLLSCMVIVDRTNCAPKVKDGKLVLSEKRSNEMLEIANFGQEVLNALIFKGRVNAAFWRSITIIYDHFPETDKARFIERCALERGNYVQMAKVSDQLKEFSRIYNSGRHRSKIKFEEYIETTGASHRDYSKTCYLHNAKQNIQTLKKQEDK